MQLLSVTGSCVTANFSVEDITAQIRDRLYEYQALQQNYTAQNENLSDEEKGDTTPMNENENKTTGIEEGQVPTENTAALTEPAGNEATPPNENITTEPAAAPAEENTAPTTEPWQPKLGPPPIASLHSDLMAQLATALLCGRRAGLCTLTLTLQENASSSCAKPKA